LAVCRTTYASACIECAESPAPGSPGSLRTANQRRVIEILQDRSDTAEITQAEIARATQLAPTTVSNIVRELSGSGLLDTTAGAGRRGTSVRFAQGAGFIAGVDLGHRHVKVAVGDLAGRILAETGRPIAPDHHWTGRRWSGRCCWLWAGPSSCSWLPRSASAATAIDQQ